MRAGARQGVYKCAKLGLKGKAVPGLIDSSASMRDRCLGIGTASQPDPKGKLAKKCTDPNRGVQLAIEKSCSGQNLAGLFACNSGSPFGTSTCLNNRIECRVCRHLNRADGLNRDCDLFDDGAANLSCACGDGQLNAGESCDDGNNVSGDGCNAFCQWEVG